MKLDEIDYILENIDWKSCLIITNVPGVGGTHFDLVDKENIHLLHGMVVVTNDDVKTFLSLDSIIGFKLFNMSRDEYINSLITPLDENSFIGGL